jgi:ribonuclease HII
MQFPTFKNELEYLNKGYAYVGGCDEVGVGPVAGPVVAAACVIDPSCIGTYRSKSKWYYRVRDSKTTNEKEREQLLQEILSHCVTYGIGEVDPAKIDEINIHQASLFAMKLAIEDMTKKLKVKAGESQNLFLFIDGRFVVKDLNSETVQVEQKAVIDGDALVLSISAASIIAKVHRDDILKEYDKKLPDYGFAKHKGYNTKEHRKAILEHGITEFHRRSFLKNIMSY